jgi:hypothetical protein
MTGTSRRLSTTLLAVCVAVGALGCGSSDSATKDKTAAATTAAPAVQTTPPAVTTAVTTTPPATATTPTTPPRSVATRSANGKMYRCIGANLLSNLHKLDGRVTTGRRVLRRIKHELTQTKHKYPSNVAPPHVAQRYNFLVRKYNAQVKLIRHRVRVYNHTLTRECSRE